VDRVRQVQERDKWWAAILWAGRSSVRIPAGKRDSLLHETVYTGSGTHTAFYSLGTGGKAAGTLS
jgi:hypothetical protein